MPQGTDDDPGEPPVLRGCDPVPARSVTCSRSPRRPDGDAVASVMDVAIAMETEGCAAMESVESAGDVEVLGVR